ncbi:MAG: hemerythrin domain-containing protein [Trichlorobacter sp.]|nr:hemerythrin domain-containing protein [Trichlorobacter sp.]
MKADITGKLMEEHQLILRMITVLEKNAALTEKGSFTDWQFYHDAVDFIRQYADRFHHAKEEDVLFEVLVENGMPREHSPVAAMVMEHEQSRLLVANLVQAVKDAETGNSASYGKIAENALGYAALLRDHIAKEDGVLYPLSERIIPDNLRIKILDGYRAATDKAEKGIDAYYTAMVEKYEATA